MSFLKCCLWAFCGLLLMSTQGQAGLPQNVSAPQARDLLNADPGIFILDVRTPEEYQQVRLEGARLVPIDQVVKRIGELPQDRPILVYCAVGSRSSQVANYLGRLGYPTVYNLYGGIYAWQLRGYPVLLGRP